MRAVWTVHLIRMLASLALVGVGVFVALSTWLQPILHNDHISLAAASAMLAGMLVAGTIGCAVVPPVVARASAERRYLETAVVWVFACRLGLAVLHRGVSTRTSGSRDHRPWLRSARHAIPAAPATSIGRPAGVLCGADVAAAAEP